MPKIFISYRRDDSAGMAGRVYDRLEARFGRDNIFMDIDAIPLGVDFREHLHREVGECDVVLAVIGRNWFGRTAEGVRRLDDPKDFVRIEIEAALARGIPVIPVLIDKVTMPAESELPASVASLAYRNAILVDPGRDFHGQVDRLIRGIDRLFEQGAAPAPKPAAPRPAAVEPAPVPDEPAKRITNRIGMKLVLIPSGTFLMGSPRSDQDASNFHICLTFQEEPQHRVQITRPFYLGATAVTVGQFRKVVEATGLRTEAETDGKGSYGWNQTTKKWEQNPKYTWRNPGFAQTDEHPVVNVSWNDAIAFCNKLSELEGLKPCYQSAGGAQPGGEGYRLPTEAEWEYACRAGSITRYTFGDDAGSLGEYAWDDAGSLGEYAWFDGNSGGMTHPVGQKRANAFGLHDMHGNVWEWCWDWYAADYYRESPGADPLGPSQAAFRVLRGGSWYNVPQGSRSALRNRGTPGLRNSNAGFRVARVQSGR
jgi:formylglycine-generating enzyme required for sulfatase activity